MAGLGAHLQHLVFQDQVGSLQPITSNSVHLKLSGNSFPSLLLKLVLVFKDLDLCTPLERSSFEIVSCIYFIVYKVFVSLAVVDSPPVETTSSPAENADSAEVERNGACGDINLQIHPYERLKVMSRDPVKGIDVAKREVLLFCTPLERLR